MRSSLCDEGVLSRAFISRESNEQLVESTQELGKKVTFSACRTMTRKLLGCNSLRHKNGRLPSCLGTFTPGSNFGDQRTSKEIVNDRPLLLSSLGTIILQLMCFIPRNLRILGLTIRLFKNKRSRFEKVKPNLVDRGPIKNKLNRSMLFTKGFHDFSMNKSSECDVVNKNRVNGGTTIAGTAK